MGYIDQLFNLDGKVALITGAGSLGSVMARGLAQAGVKVAVMNLHQESADKVKQKINEVGGEGMAFSGDVTDQQALEQVRDQLFNAWDTPDILVNGAGGNMPGATIPPGKTFFDLSIDDFKKVMDLNLTGTVLPTQIFAKAMAERGKGSIINISSMAAKQAITRVVGYSAAKASVENFTMWMATELAQKFGEGLRVNAMAPGFFIGEQNRRLLTNEDGSYTERGETIIRNTPMGRFGDAEELIGALLWLSGDASRFATGIVVPVDGGFSAFSGV